MLFSEIIYQAGSLYSEILLETPPRSALFFYESSVFLIFKNKIFLFHMKQFKVLFKNTCSYFIQKRLEENIDQMLEMDAYERWNYE